MTGLPAHSDAGRRGGGCSGEPDGVSATGTSARRWLRSAPARRRRCGRSARRRSRTRSAVAASRSRASASRSSARARNRRVRTVAAGMARHSAVSCTLMSSTSRMTKTVRKATGSSSIRALEQAADLAPQHGLLAAIRSSSSATSASVGSGSTPGSIAQCSPKGTTTRSRLRRRSRMSAWLMTMRVSQVASWASAAEVADVAIGVEVGVLQRVFGLRVVPAGSRARRGRAGRCAAASASRTPRDRPARRARRAPSRRATRRAAAESEGRRIAPVTPCSVDVRTRADVPGFGGWSRSSGPPRPSLEDDPTTPEGL